jgi:hypothetical protein
MKIMKPTKYCKEKKEEMQGIIKIQWGEFDQSTIYSYMEIPQ